MSTRRVVAGLVAMALGAMLISVLPGSPPASAAAAEPAGTDSAVTKPGTGDFANLTVTVGQTKNLINQTIKVSWTGGAPSNPVDFYVNYLQIMQCWGDDPAGPDRTQCQFGASTPGGLDWTTDRQVSYGRDLVDQQEELKVPAGSGAQAYVPFWAAGRPKPTGPATEGGNEFFDSLITNEIALARTRTDRTGEEFFEVQTLRQAAGLGCGQPVTTGGSTTGRSCWLVIVPRGNKEVDGSIRDGRSSNSALRSSALSRSNWDNRIVIPLEFRPVEQACPIGAAERPLVGHELVVDAVTSWQPVLCAGGGPVLSYSQLTDDVARIQVPEGRLALVTNPVPPELAPAAGPLVYAPVGLSGLAIAFNIDHQPPADAPAAKLRLNGQRFTSMKLTPLLVAKLLTQSYFNSVTIQDEVLNNPLGLLFDQEFLDLNPEYKGFAELGQPVPDALVQLNGADVTSLLWSWVKADPDASAFLAGEPDKFGMRINPRNKDLALPTSTFPRNDDRCRESKTEHGDTLRFCTQDAHPFANDMHDAGRSASRGDTKAKTSFIPNPGEPPNVKNVERQGAGRRGLLAVVDTATATRYGLPTAQLLNAAGKYVAPTTESLLAGQAAMKPGAVAGVLASDPGASDPAAYPLTALSYAVAAPATMDAAAGKDYAAFLRHAGGPGQQPGIAPGQLPFGMVPLPDPLKAQTLAAATTVEAQTALRPPAPTTPLPTQDPTGGSNTSAGASGTATNTGGGGTGATPGVTAPAITAPGAGPLAKAPSVVQQPVAGARRTPPLSAPTVAGFLVAILAIGALAAFPPVRHLLRGGLRQRWRRGVTPTER